MIQKSKRTNLRNFSCSGCVTLDSCANPGQPVQCSCTCTTFTILPIFRMRHVRQLFSLHTSDKLNDLSCILNHHPWPMFTVQDVHVRQLFQPRTPDNLHIDSQLHPCCPCSGRAMLDSCFSLHTLDNLINDLFPMFRMRHVAELFQPADPRQPVH